jgi:hypothetical protein
MSGCGGRGARVVAAAKLGAKQCGVLPTRSDQDLILTR